MAVKIPRGLIFFFSIVLSVELLVKEFRRGAADGLIGEDVCHGVVARCGAARADADRADMPRRHSVGEPLAVGLTGLPLGDFPGGHASQPQPFRCTDRYPRLYHPTRVHHAMLSRESRKCLISLPKS